MKTAAERAIATVPRWVLVLLAVSICLQVAWQASQPAPSALVGGVDGAPIVPELVRGVPVPPPINPNLPFNPAPATTAPSVR